eukprot:14490149-Alexandrium_andersonii.AAC.1
MAAPLPRPPGQAAQPFAQALPRPASELLGAAPWIGAPVFGAAAIPGARMPPPAPALPGDRA